MTTITNSFHNTAAKTRMTYDRCSELAQGAPATDKEKAIMKRLKIALCGVAGCKCSDRLGSRK